MKYLLSALFLLSLSAHSASYDCRKAANYAERAICQDATLSSLDEVMAYNYRIMLAANNISAQSKKHLRQSQRAWLRKRNQCRSHGCLENLYRHRIWLICQYPTTWGNPPSCLRQEEIF